MNIPDKYIKLIETAVNMRVEELNSILESYERIPEGTILNNLEHLGYQLAKDNIAAYEPLQALLSNKKSYNQKKAIQKDTSL